MSDGTSILILICGIAVLILGAAVIHPYLMLGLLAFVIRWLIWIGFGKH